MYVFPNKDFHLSRKYIGEHNVLKPTGNFNPPGISFASSIRECLEGVPFYFTEFRDWNRRKGFVREGNIWYVYTPIDKRESIIPDTIDDFNRTHEKRVLGKIHVELVGKIRVSVRGNAWKYRWI